MTMALDVAVVESFISGSFRETIVDVTFDDHYPTGGEAVNTRQLGFAARVDHISPALSDGYVVMHDQANETLVVFEGNYGEVAAGPLAEVANDTDLAALTVRLRCVGV